MSSSSNFPPIVFTDIDGVWTDGGMYYDQTGNEMKLFNTGDSAGVLFARKMGAEVVILTGEDTQIVARRAEKLKIKELHQGVKDKLGLARQIAERLGVDLADCAYIGDDFIDIELLREVKWSAAPENAPDYVKNEVNWQLQKKGGEGAFREFVERMIAERMNMKEFLEEFIYRK